MEKDLKIFIYGVPGAGKTSFSLALQKRLGYPLVEADVLRGEVQKESEDAFLRLGTAEAFKQFGEFSEENVIKGMLAVRHAMQPHILRELEKYPKELIVEAAFLDPKELLRFGKLVLIVTPDGARHRKQYFEHRTENQSTTETFNAARIIQNYLLEEVKQLPVIAIENNDAIENLAKKINVSVMEYHLKVEQFVIDSFTKINNPGDVHHLQRTVYWLKELRPDADEALCIAAVAHDIERAFRNANDPRVQNWASKEYYDMHQEGGAKIIQDFLKEQGAPDSLGKRVYMLISKHEIGGNDDQNLLKDADSVSFLENQVDMFVAKKVPELGKEKVKEKFQRMFDRITSEKAKELAKPLFEEAIKKL